MTALSPQQMRDMADSGDENPTDLEDALRTAADQLEAVRMKAAINATVSHALGRSEQERSWLDILAIIPPDTAPEDAL